jgi:hypothetical protein
MEEKYYSLSLVEKLDVNVQLGLKIFKFLIPKIVKSTHDFKSHKKSCLLIILQEIYKELDNCYFLSLNNRYNSARKLFRNVYENLLNLNYFQIFDKVSFELDDDFYTYIMNFEKVTDIIKYFKENPEKLELFL